MNSREDSEHKTTGNTVSTDAAPLIPHIPEHEVLRRIGQGSYGTVWLALNRLGTSRAVKVVVWDEQDPDRLAEREYEGIKNFEPISRSHDGLVDVLQVGRDEQAGFFYYVMELGDDRKDGPPGGVPNPETYVPKTLADELARRGRLPANECVALGLRLSEAIDHLHRHELVHRDIKPSNIIFVRGTPKLADIGLVRTLKEARTYVGTTGFIPPEGPGTFQADVYSLGKVLYELSTGLDRQEFPELPRALNTWPDAEECLELNEIIIKACQPERAERYATAHDLHADLFALSKGKSIKRLHWLEQRLAKAKRLGIGAAVAGCVALAVGVAVNREIQHAAEMRQREIGGMIADGIHDVDAGDFLSSLPAFAAAWQLEPGLHDPAHRLRLGTVLDACPKLTHLWVMDEAANDVEFSPDGTRVLISMQRRGARICNLASGQPVGPPFGAGPGLETASFSHDGTWIVTAGWDKTATIWNAQTRERIRQLPHPARVKNAHFSPDDRWVVTACNNHLAYLWNAHTGTLARELRKHTDLILYAAFSHDGRRIVTCSIDHTALIWDATTGNLAAPPLRHPNWVYGAAFSPDDRFIVTASYDRNARIWEVESGEELPPPLKHDDGITSVDYSPDGRWIVTSSFDKTVRVWDTYSRQPVRGHPMLKHSGGVIHAAFDPDSHRIVSACADGTVRVWDLAGCATARREIHPASISPSGQLLTWQSNTVQILEVNTGITFQPTLDLPQPVQTTSLSRNGSYILARYSIASGMNGASNLVQVGNVRTGEKLSPPIPIAAAGTGVLLSEDGQHVAVYSDQTAQLYDARTGQPSLPPIHTAAAISNAVFSPDSHILLTVCGRSVQLWEVDSGALHCPALLHSKEVWCVQFRPDGQQVVTGTQDNGLNKCVAQVWDTRNGQSVGPPLPHKDGVLYVAFSDDGRRLVTTGEDFTAMVWDADTKQPITMPLQHKSKVYGAAFSENGQWLVTVCGHQTARIWDIATSRPITPPVPIGFLALRVQFAGDDRYLLTANNHGGAAILKLPFAHETADELGQLADLETGITLATSNEANAPGGRVSLHQRWESLRVRCPDAFVVSPTELATWHENQVHACMDHQQWNAALFHLDRLQNTSSGNAEQAQHLAHLRQEILELQKRHLE